MSGPAVDADQPLDAATVRSLTERVLAEHADSDDVTFQGALYDAGLAWIHWPRGSGGLDQAPGLQDVVDTTLEAAKRRPAWMRNPMGVGMVGPAIAQLGRDDQRQQYLRPIYTAEEVWCQLFSEPSAGSDVATLATRAVLDGQEWVVNGQKVWTSAAHRAQRGLLLARTDPDVPKHKGLTAFILDMHAPGVDVRPLRDLSGGEHFNEVYLTDVRILDTERLGEIGDGWRVAVTTLMNERVSIGGRVAPKSSGAIAFALDAWERHGGGPAERDALSRLWIEAEVLRIGRLRAQALRERGTPGPEGSVLKLAGGLLDQRILELALHLQGANSLLVPSYNKDEDRTLDIVLSFLAGQGSTIAGGTSEIMRNILGERILGLPPEPRSDRDVAWKDIPRGV
jgi:alkylation response protein AidB-like acyl-CoA dehydrogenase